jgi:ABC-type microcin C transport system permease subunit YejB
LVFLFFDFCFFSFLLIGRGWRVNVHLDVCCWLWLSSLVNDDWDISFHVIHVITVIGIGIALLIGGVVVTESVYAIPGLGRLTVDAVLARDFPTIQGVILFFSFIYVLVNLLVDLSYVFFDPRIRY